MGHIIDQENPISEMTLVPRLEKNQMKKYQATILSIVANELMNSNYLDNVK